MDPNVLAAQRWVNATYSGVTGYNPIAENGIAGWDTLHALTRGLQHELGITVLSDTFGPSTLAGLQARGGILVQDTNTNLIRIVQCGCYCKGYDAGGIDGVFGASTQNAVNAMMGDAGLESTLGTAVTPKVVKALLTTDSYRLSTRGSAPIRAVQRWLNNRYLPRTNFFLIPADGILTRDLQKSFYVAIQYETGLTDAQADGSFGPQSKAALRPHTLAAGDTGPYVNLFTAAMVFNRIRLADGSTYALFTDTFSAQVTDAVRVFQAFSELPVTGTGNFSTWCQLLVSNGDADRPGTALDCITTITDVRAQALLSAGYRVVGRYLDERASTHPLNKQLQPGELDTIFRNGLRVFPISEYSAGSAAYFTYAQGYQDATDAHTAATAYGFDLDTVIYFAVDYDATDADITAHIIPYFTGVAGALAVQGKRYIPAVYASRNVCAQLATAAYTRWSFVAGMSTSYTGNLSFPLPDNWAFNQIQNAVVGTGASRTNIDKNVWRSGSDPAVAAVNRTPAGVDTLIAYVRQLRDLAVSYGGPRPPDQLVLEYLRHDTHRDDQWADILGPLDTGYLNAVAAAGIPAIREIADPGTGVPLHVSRIAAACNGAYLHPAPTPDSAGPGDLPGWAGNWLTFYGQWRRDLAAYPSPSDYCQQKLGQAATTGTFTRRDLIETADGHILATAVAAGTSLPDALTNHYNSGGYRTRYTQLLTNRFAADSANAAAAAKAALLTGAGPLATARTWHIHTTAGLTATMPENLPGTDLDHLGQGFATTLAGAAAQENPPPTNRQPRHTTRSPR